MNLTSHTLHQLVVDLHLEETQTLDALLAQMTGDYAASRMLARILYWRDKAIKFGGWVWKSWRDWYAECGLSQGQIKRVHRDGILEQFGMARSLMKANGAPTTHYLLDEDAFVSKLAEFLQMTFDEVKLRLSMIANGETSTLKKKKRLARSKQIVSMALMSMTSATSPISLFHRSLKHNKMLPRHKNQQPKMRTRLLTHLLLMRTFLLLRRRRTSRLTSSSA
jgi:hypothetical protein